MAARRAALVAVLAAQLAACATTHRFGRASIPQIAALTWGPRGGMRVVRARDGAGETVAIRPESEMVLHLTDGPRRLHVATRPSQLRILPQGLTLRGAYVPASAVVGFEVEQPRRGRTVALSLALTGVGLLVGALLFIAVVGPPIDCDCES